MAQNTIETLTDITFVLIGIQLTGIALTAASLDLSFEVVVTIAILGVIVSFLGFSRPTLDLARSFKSANWS
jgi:hypothetical protein